MLLDEDVCFLMKGNRYPSLDFQVNPSDEDVRISAEPYGTKKPLEEDRMEMKEIENEERMVQNISKGQIEIRWQYRESDDTRNAEKQTELMDDDGEEDRIVPQLFGNVTRTRWILKNTRKTPGTEGKEEMIGTRFTPDEALKLSIALEV